jgi:hypothetical protein
MKALGRDLRALRHRTRAACRKATANGEREVADLVALDHDDA